MMQETLLSGTARKAEIPGWTAAGKTGTSQDFRDAWFIGYTANLVTGVWLGNDDNSPTKKATGGGLPVEVWTRFMRAAHQGVPVAACRTRAAAASCRTSRSAAPRHRKSARPRRPRSHVTIAGSASAAPVPSAQRLSSAGADQRAYQPRRSVRAGADRAGLDGWRVAIGWFGRYGCSAA